MSDAGNTQLPATRRGVVAVIRRAGRLLVIRRAPHIVAGGAYCFPGGAIEADESEEVALVRELREELGVTIVPLRRMWQSLTSWNVSLAWWEAELADEAEIVPHPAEVESFHWFTPAELAVLENVLESNRQFLAEFPGL